MSHLQISSWAHQLKSSFTFCEFRPQQCHPVGFISGVMAARGILSNPAMYAGYDQTTMDVVQDWVNSLHLFFNKDNIMH